MFSAGISEERGDHLATFLGVKRVNQHAIYLGLSKNVGRSRSVIFKMLVTRVEKKLKDWKSKTLSHAGKLTLAILIYLMSKKVKKIGPISCSGKSCVGRYERVTLGYRIWEILIKPSWLAKAREPYIMQTPSLPTPLRPDTFLEDIIQTTFGGVYWMVGELLNLVWCGYW
ncbi:hypothetical protein ACS0TY_029890 [Phlomoides rotata]